MRVKKKNHCGGLIALLKLIAGIKLLLQKSLWRAFLGFRHKIGSNLSFFGIYSRYVTATVADLIKEQQLFSYSPPKNLINWINTHIRSHVTALKSRCLCKTASMTRGAEKRPSQSEFCHYYNISRSGICLSVLVMEAGRNTHFNNSLL